MKTTLILPTLPTFILLLIFIPCVAFSQYNGTGSVTRGLATTASTNLYPCSGGRTTNVGTIVSTDSKVWTVPAMVNFTNASFPFASVLHNPCTGATYANQAAALAALDGTDVMTIDPSGELITAYIFADNYFEMYINGVAVGKDDVPFTQFNSNIVRFRVHRPFTIAMLLVDWEEHLGVGCEANNGVQYHMGDGGMVAVFQDSLNNVVAVTGPDWKAQTFYTSPILDLSCTTENGSKRLSNNCSTQGSNNGNEYYALHWDRPESWMSPLFDDSIFPQASTYSNSVVGVDNKPAYTNFTNIFDNPSRDAAFIWSTNLVLDNEVIVRYTVPGVTGLPGRSDNQDLERKDNVVNIFPNPTSNNIHISIDPVIESANVHSISICNMLGESIFEADYNVNCIPLSNLPRGMYILQIQFRRTLLSSNFFQERMLLTLE